MNIAKPKLSIKEISDAYVQNNFKKLQDYFNSQNQLQDFNFVEFVFSGAIQNQKLAHGLSIVPQDVLIMRLTGPGALTLNWGLFDSKNLDITTTGACRVRLFVGSFWNFQSSAGTSPSDVQSIFSSVPVTPSVKATATTTVSSSTFTNNQNLLVNGGFDWWQAGTSTTLTASGGGAPTSVTSYLADQWYCNNILGGSLTEGQITYKQVAGVLSGSLFGAQVFISRAPAGTGIQNGCELWTVLSNLATVPLIGQTVSFSVQVVQATGTVNQVGIQLFYATTEAKPGLAIGTEQTFPVGAFPALCQVNGIALGTSMTTAGVIGVRIRIAGVSSGNLYDSSNGFIVEQAMLNLGTTAQTFARQFNDPVQEFQACRFFFQALGPGASGAADNSATTVGLTGAFNPPMRTTPGSVAIASGTYSVRHQGGDKVSSNPPVIANFSGNTVSWWSQLSTFSTLTANQPAYDRGGGIFGYADARI